MLFEANPEVDIREQSPLNLAFVGDGVFELLVRQRLVERTRLVPGKLHAACVKYVSAKGQNRALAAIEDQLTEAEQAVLRRGKNASKATQPRRSTGRPPALRRCSAGCISPARTSAFRSCSTFCGRATTRWQWKSRNKRHSLERFAPKSGRALPENANKG